MKRAIGFSLGQRGDLVIGTVTARAFKQHFNERGDPYHLTLGVGPQFRDMLPLFHDHPFYDAVHTYSTYDGWPGPVDTEYLEAAHYDFVFHGMPAIRDDWFRHGHQAAEVTRLRGLAAPTDLNCVLTRWFDTENRSDWVAFAPFAAWYHKGVEKQFTVERAQQVVDLLVRRGLKVLQLGGPTEPTLNGAVAPQLCYFDSVRAMLSCRALIHSDTGLGWVASAYKHPQLGLYSLRHFGQEYIAHIQPVNPNGVYLEAAGTVNDIPLDRIDEVLGRVLS